MSIRNLFKGILKPKLKIDMRLKKSQLRKLTKAQERTAILAMEALKTEIAKDEVVPKQTGTLEESATLVIKALNKGQVRITYDTPYARRLYYHPEYDFRKDKNANAKGLWLEDYIDGEKKDFLGNTYAQLYRREAGT